MADMIAAERSVFGAPRVLRSVVPTAIADEALYVVQRNPDGSLSVAAPEPDEIIDDKEKEEN
jgi:hypothetical protein